jgi:hypothetical protein
MLTEVEIRLRWIRQHSGSGRIYAGRRLSVIFEQRPDFSHGLIHFTRKRIGKTRHFENDPNEAPFFDPDTTEVSAIDVLAEILKDGILRGSNKKGFIKGDKPAVCFSEVPLASVRYFVPGNSGRYSHITASRSASGLRSSTVLVRSSIYPIPKVSGYHQNRNGDMFASSMATSITPTSGSGDCRAISISTNFPDSTF